MRVTDPAPIPAATLILMRDRVGAAPELLMVERNKAMAFAGGALVFPGGRVDPGDWAMAELIGADRPDEAAARIAAIRETLEEAGIGVGVDPAIRAALHAGQGIAEALEGAPLDLGLLTPFARWLPLGLHRVFDTRFYLAAAPEGADPEIDGGETVRAFWASASEVLAMIERGEAAAIFPTRRNLERLATFGSLGDALADAHAHPVRTITPWREFRDGVEHLCIPDDAGYPVTSQPMATVVRA